MKTPDKENAGNENASLKEDVKVRAGDARARKQSESPIRRRFHRARINKPREDAAAETIRGGSPSPQVKPDEKTGGRRERPTRVPRPVGNNRNELEKKVPKISRPAVPVETYRVEGIGRKGTVRHVKVVGVPGKWEIFGLNDLHVEVKAQTVSDVLRIARRKIPFRPVAVRKIENS